MALRKYWWVLIPLAAGLGCAGSQQEQKVAKAGGTSELKDEGPASASAQGAAEQNAATGAAGAGAAGVAAAGQPAQLVPFQGANGFTVLMPPNPEKNERTQDTPGGPVQVHIASAQDASGKFMSSLSEFPKGSLDRVKSKDLLDSLQQATVQSMGGTLVNSQDIQVGGLPGREFTATDPQGSEVTARVFVGDSRVYTLAGTYPKGQVPASIQQFLGSFQPPAGTAVGGSGPASATDSSGSASAPSNTGAAAGGAAASDSMSTGSDSSAATSPAQPSSKSKKKSSRSTTSSTTDSTSVGSGSR